MNVQELCQNMISMIRDSVLSSINTSGIDDHDPWNEFEHGAGWCENELSMFNNIYQILFPYNNVPDYSGLHSVQAVCVTLRRQSEQYLTLCYRFLELGGTSDASFFTLRERANRDDIIAHLDVHPLTRLSIH
jgi:hypothetical protein